MKLIHLINISIISLLLFQGCSSKKELQTNASIKTGVSSDIAWSTTTKRDKKMQGQGALQKSLDKWLKEEWNPSFEGNVTESNNDSNASTDFTLQHYYDKSKIYLMKKEEERIKSGEEKEPAHYEKIGSLPVIGK